MKIKNLLAIRQNIYKLLTPEEQLLAFSSSKSGSSVYVLLINSNNEYICFRISDHQTSPFYSNRTFFFKDDLENLSLSIRQYLDKTSWYKFTYTDFYGLLCLKYMKIKDMSVYIDNSANIFGNEDMGMLFYQMVERSHNKKDIHAVSETFQKTLRKLYSSGLISDIKLFDGARLIYTTAEGAAMLELNMPIFLNKFIQDYDSINWNYIEVK